MRYLPEDNLSYPVLIQIGNGSGSGFYFISERKFFLVTALHVLYKVEDPTKPLRANTLKLTCYDRNISILTPHEFSVDLSRVNIRKNDLKDIALVQLANIDAIGQAGRVSLCEGVQQLTSNVFNLVGVPSEHFKRFNNVLVSNEVFILGYPSSLGQPEQPQIEYNKPLLRKGVIAGKNTINETIILDCPVYFGNSGGVAIEVEHISLTQNKFWVIGVVSQYVPFIEKLKSVQLGYTNLNFENSGYSVVVPIDTILELAADNSITITPTRESDIR